MVIMEDSSFTPCGKDVVSCTAPDTIEIVCCSARHGCPAGGKGREGERSKKNNRVVSKVLYFMLCPPVNIVSH